MRLVYDYQAFFYYEYGGITRYFCELAKHISRFTEIDVTIIAPTYINKYLINYKSGRVIGKYLPPVQKTTKIRKYINDIITKILLQKNPPDIVHETYYGEYKLSPRKTKTVVTVHDMIHELFKEDVKSAQEDFSLIKAQAIKRADHVICVSENTKKDLVEILNVETSKISVIYHGHSFIGNHSKLENRIVSQPYILYIGSRSGYKNFRRLLEAYAYSNRVKKDFKLVCFGGKSLSEDEKNEIIKLGLSKNEVMHISGGDNVLGNLYANAVALVCPSLYEGFGMPLLEAMSYRCPVICSNRSSLPEVAGDAAEYFDPYDYENIMNTIENVVYSNEKSKNLIARGLVRRNRFSWEECAKNTLLVYLSLLK